MLTESLLSVGAGIWSSEVDMAKGELMVRIGGTSWIVKAADSAFGGGRERKEKNVLILLKKMPIAKKMVGV